MTEGPAKTVPRGRKIAAVIVAAGRGERAGKADGPKQYREIGGRPIIAWTLQAFADHPEVSEIVFAIHADDRESFDAAAQGFSARAVIGGATRQESVLLALESLSGDPPDIVLIHDGVRPFVSSTTIDLVIAAAGQRHGSIPALPLVETIKRGDAYGHITGTVDRDGLYGAQTPQAFQFDAILAAHRSAAAAHGQIFTDDASIAEWAGIDVRLVEGSPDNIKITYARDVEMADQKLAGSFPDVRIGNGYDVHSFEAGDAVTLCGVAIPHDKKLSGHSDADVALHALTDALLATCGAGDIGTHFPPSDLQWRGAASSIFVERAVAIVRERGGRIANADITLIAEAPRIGPHREAMTEKLTALLGVGRDRVSVKATTNEKLGFVGREEGIAAIATASVVFPGSLPR